MTIAHRLEPGLLRPADLAARQIVMAMQASNPGADPLREVLTRYGGRRYRRPRRPAAVWPQRRRVPRRRRTAGYAPPRVSPPRQRLSGARRAGPSSSKVCHHRAEVVRRRRSGLIGPDGAAPFWKTKRLEAMTRGGVGIARATAAAAAACTSCATRRPASSPSPMSPAGCSTPTPAAARDYANRASAACRTACNLTPDSRARDRLAAALLRLSPAGRGQGPGVVAPAGLRRSGDGAPGRHLGARPRGAGARGRAAGAPFVDWPGRMPRDARDAERRRARHDEGCAVRRRECRRADRR